MRSLLIAVRSCLWLSIGVFLTPSYSTTESIENLYRMYAEGQIEESRQLAADLMESTTDEATLITASVHFDFLKAVDSVSLGDPMDFLILDHRFLEIAEHNEFARLQSYAAGAVNRLLQGRGKQAVQKFYYVFNATTRVNETNLTLPIVRRFSKDLETIAARIHASHPQFKLRIQLAHWIEKMARIYANDPVLLIQSGLLYQCEGCHIPALDNFLLAEKSAFRESCAVYVDLCLLPLFEARSALAGGQAFLAERCVDGLKRIVNVGDGVVSEEVIEEATLLRTYALACRRDREEARVEFLNALGGQDSLDLDYYYHVASEIWCLCGVDSSQGFPWKPVVGWGTFFQDCAEIEPEMFSILAEAEKLGDIYAGAIDFEDLSP